MGYFSNGLVFFREPDFKEAASVAVDRHARGYKHNQFPVWLLDLWKTRGKIQRRRAPFCDPAATGFRADVTAVDVATREFLLSLDRLKKAVRYPNSDPEEGGTHLALAIADATRCPTFFFAADDDETDMACSTMPGSVVSFRCRFDRLAVRYASGQTTVTPLNFLEDFDDEGTQERIEKIRQLPGITLLPIKEIEGGQVLYENPVAEWPKEGGDPAAIFGLGTWDPLLNLEDNFTVVYERLVD